MIGALERHSHVLGHRAGHHQHVGVARRGDKAQAEALEVVIGVAERMNLQLAPVAGAGIDFPDRQRPPEPPPRQPRQRCAELGERGLIGRRRRFRQRHLHQTL